MSQTKSKIVKQRKSQNRSLVPLLLGLGGVVLVALAGIFIALGGGGKKASIVVQGSPSLKVDKEKLDFGDVKLGNWVEAEFTLTNVGDQPLQFTDQPYIEVVEGC